MDLTISEAMHALKSGDFVPHFQPLITLRTGQLAGFEILARYNHPQNGRILPAHFIPMAEKDGWIGDLMVELLRQAFESAHLIPDTMTLSINVSPVQLLDLGLPVQIRTVAEDAGFDLNRLIIEITESALTDNLEYARYIASQLNRLGCRLALDDFGTGYSSLLHLQSLPFDDLKVDRSFVGTMTEQRDSRKIVAAVVGLGQSLGLTTVAEGVETKEQAEMLLWMGCDIGQGWLFGRPMPADQLAEAVNMPRQRLSTGVSSKLLNVSATNVDTLPAQRLAQLQAVYDGSPVGLAFLDRSARYVNLNQRLADMNGFTVEEHLGKSVSEMLPDLYPKFGKFILRALQGEVIPGVELQRLDAATNLERTVLLSYQPAFDEANEVVGVSVAQLDITERKSASDAVLEHKRKEIDLLKAQAQLRAVVGTIPLGIILADVTVGSLSLANTEALRILGEPIPTEPSVYTPWIQANADSTLVAAAEVPLTRALLRGETTAPKDVLCHRSDGSETWVSLSGAPILGPNDEIVGGVVVLQDIDVAKQERLRLRLLADALVRELEPEGESIARPHSSLHGNGHGKTEVGG